MSSRPVYIPPAKRKSGSNSRPQRFHGAFTGGFSAGYFNTVDTKEGWKPTNQKRKDQRLEDFMDEQDHEEWGGPTKIRQDYQTIAEEKTSTSRPGPPNQTESLDTLLRISHQSIGPRLLRKLGWREDGKAAIVPLQEGETTNEIEGEDREANILLSSKRLKKIRLQTHRFEIPPPKLDVCGLGFEPHQDAPEFKAFRERRKQRAKERQGAAGTSNVYRASTLTTDDKGNDVPVGKDDKGADDYLNYAETTEDFIGKKSVGGFAFRDDEDDAYDNTGNERGGKISRETLGDEYNMEIYEHQDSDNEEPAGAVTFDPSREQSNDRGLVQRKNDLGSVLASWANTSKTTTTKGTALMSNGKPPLEGFNLGGSINAHTKRYPGPDIPRDYIIKRHVFGENEHPLIFQTIARAVKLQEKEHQLQRMNKKPLPPLAGSTNFVNLADAMKSRFTSSKTEEKTTTERVGLYKPDPLVSKRRQAEETTPTNMPTVKKTIVLKRTVQSFLPHPLLCKRFGVPVPKNAIGISMNASTLSSNQSSRVTEANYFEKEIMSVRESEKLAKKKDVEEKRSSGAKMNADLDMEQDPEGLQRPSMEKLRSIFAADSDSESSTDLDASSDEDGEKEDNPNEEILQRAKDIVANVVGVDNTKPPLVPEEPHRNEDGADDKSMSSSSASSGDSRRRERRRKRKSSHRKRSSKRRKRSRSPDSQEDSDDDRRRRRKERRRKHDRKHRKKKSSHARRKRDRED